MEEGLPGAPVEQVRVRAMAGKDRQPRDKARLQPQRVDLVGLGRDFEELLRDLPPSLGACRRQHHRELGFARVRDDRRRFQGAAQSLRHLRDQAVGDGATEDLVHFLVALDGQPHEDQGLAAGLGRSDRLREQLAQVGPVGQSADGLVQHQPAHGLLRLRVALARGQGLQAERQVGGRFQQRFPFEFVEGVRLGRQDGQCAEDLLAEFQRQRVDRSKAVAMVELAPFRRDQRAVLDVVDQARLAGPHGDARRASGLLVPRHRLQPRERGVVADVRERRHGTAFIVLGANHGRGAVPGLLDHDPADLLEQFLAVVRAQQRPVAATERAQRPADTLELLVA